jgi:cell division protein FtsW
VVYDLGLLFPVLLLVGMGIVMVYSASSALAFKKFGSDYFFLKNRPCSP